MKTGQDALWIGTLEKVWMVAALAQLHTDVLEGRRWVC